MCYSLPLPALIITGWLGAPLHCLSAAAETAPTHVVTKLVTMPAPRTSGALLACFRDSVAHREPFTAARTNEEDVLIHFEDGSFCVMEILILATRQKCAEGFTGRVSVELTTYAAFRVLLLANPQVTYNLCIQDDTPLPVPPRPFCLLRACFGARH